MSGWDGIMAETIQGTYQVDFQSLIKVLGVNLYADPKASIRELIQKCQRFHRSQDGRSRLQAVFPGNNRRRRAPVDRGRQWRGDGRRRGCHLLGQHRGADGPGRSENASRPPTKKPRTCSSDSSGWASSRPL